MQPNYYNYPYMQQPMQSGMRIDTVSSLEDAKKYPIQPGVALYLVDQKDPYIYLKTADNTGKAQMRGFALQEVDLNKIVDSRYITREDFDAFKKELLSELRGGVNNGESITSGQLQ